MSKRNAAVLYSRKGWQSTAFQTLLDCNSQYSSTLAVLVRASGSCSPTTSRGLDMDHSCSAFLEYNYRGAEIMFWTIVEQSAEIYFPAIMQHTGKYAQGWPQSVSILDLFGPPVGLLLWELGLDWSNSLENGRIGLRDLSFIKWLWCDQTHTFLDIWSHH